VFNRGIEIILGDCRTNGNSLELHKLKIQPEQKLQAVLDWRILVFLIWHGVALGICVFLPFLLLFTLSME